MADKKTRKFGTKKTPDGGQIYVRSGITAAEQLYYQNKDYAFKDSSANAYRAAGRAIEEGRRGTLSQALKKHKTSYHGTQRLKKGPSYKKGMSSGGK